MHAVHSPRTMQESLGDLVLPKSHITCSNLHEVPALLSLPEVSTVFWERSHRDWNELAKSLIASAPNSSLPAGVPNKNGIQSVRSVSATDAECAVRELLGKFSRLDLSEKHFIEAEFRLLRQFLCEFTGTQSTSHFIFTNTANTQAHTHPDQIVAIVNYYNSSTGVLLDNQQLEAIKPDIFWDFNLRTGADLPWIRPPIGSVLFMKGRSDFSLPPSLDNLGCVHRSEVLNAPSSYHLNRFAIGLIAQDTGTPRKLGPDRIDQMLEQYHTAIRQLDGEKKSEFVTNLYLRQLERFFQ